jgi:hypothetical protein
LRARALAESCKSAAYRFATRIAPYDSADAGQKLLETLQQLLASGADIPAMEVDDVEAAKGLPAYPMSVEEYVAQRVRGQIDNYYRPKALANERHAALCAHWIQGLSAAAAVLGAIGALYGAGQIEAWVAALGTVVAAVSAYALSQRYQRLAATYRVTADRLAVRLALWELGRQQQADPAVDAAFVSDAEGIMAGENQAWLAEFLKDPSASNAAAGGGGP